LAKVGHGVADRANSAALKDPLVYGINNIDLLENKKWEVGSRPWLPAVYNAVNPYWIEKDPIGRARKMCLMKPTQVGMTTMGLTKMFHFADYWSVRTIYTLPRQQDVTDLVSTRVDPMIRASKRLSGLLGNPDSTRGKAIGESYIFFMELSTEPRMMPAEALYIDEVDLSDQIHLGTVYNRLDDSNWKIINQFGTPTIGNFGIHSMYERSDMKRWMIKCPSCNTWTHLEWDKHLKIIGNRDKPEKVYFGCEKCDRELDTELILTGRWVAEKPAMTKEYVGFHLSQMMSKTPMELYKHLIDPEQSLIEFWRKRLGLPYEIEGGQLTREDILIGCFNSPLQFESFGDPQYEYYMGVDQGNEIQAIVVRYDKENNKINVVLIELIPAEVGFDRVGELMRLFEIKKAVIDGDPNRHSVKKLRESFPGRVLIADYSRIERTWQVSVKEEKNQKSKGKVPTNVAVNRTDVFDKFIGTVQDGMWSLPGGVAPIANIVETLISQWTKIKRDVEFKTMPDGRKQELAVYRSVGPDHLAHSAVYALIAVEIGKGKGFKSRMVGHQAPVSEEAQDGVNKPQGKRVLRIR